MVIFSKGLEKLSFSIMKPSFSFTNVKIFTIPATGVVNNLRLETVNNLRLFIDFLLSFVLNLGPCYYVSIDFTIVTVLLKMYVA